MPVTTAVAVGLRNQLAFGGGQLPILSWDGDINTLFAEHAASPLTIPTPPTNVEGGVTHPDVIDFVTINKSGKWNGYRYWMGFTPLPTLNQDANENPCIVASNDGVTWVVPSGGSNPIHQTPPISYNSDTTLFFEAGRLYCFFRTWTQDPTNKSWLGYKYSNDGITWSNLGLAYQTITNNEIISPCIVKNGNYYAYVINGESATVYDKKFYRYTSSSVTTFIDNRQLCNMDVSGTILSETTSDKYYPWHWNVKYINGKYLAIIYYRANTGAADYSNETIFLAASSDGVNFKLSKYPLFSKYQKDHGKWDVGFYRCAIVPKKVGNDIWFDLWYPGWANDHEIFPTFIGKSEIKKISSGITHNFTGNEINTSRLAELVTAISKTNGYTFGDDINRANGAINPTPCGVNYTITLGTPAILNNYIIDSLGTGLRLTFNTGLNYEMSFDAINGNGVISTDGGFQLSTKNKATAKFISIIDGVVNTKVIKRISANTITIQRTHKIFLKTDLNNFKVVWNGPNLKYYVNGCLIINRTFTVADFVDQADMDEILGQTTLLMIWGSGCAAKLKNVTIKAL